MKKPLRIIFRITIAIAFVPALIISIIFLDAYAHLEKKDQLLRYKNAAATVVLAEDGELIGKIFSENRTTISYGVIPIHLINALIATEDVRFFEHKGIDFRSLLRVIFKTIILGNESSGGGSTITQQLAKNMFGREKSGQFAIIKYKTKEAFLAHRLERIFTKEEILVLYLNTVPFGENVFGIDAASLRYFNKKAELLTIEESAVLVGMLKANEYYNPRINPENAKTRRNVVLNQMKRHHYLESSLTDSLIRLPLLQSYSNIESKGPADYFLYQVKNEAKQILQSLQSDSGKTWNIEEDGLIITTTLNLTLQNYSNAAFYDHLSEMQKRINIQYADALGKKIIEKIAENEYKKLQFSESADNISFRQVFDWDSLINTIRLLQAGMIAINPATGAVKAYVGGIDFKTQPYDQILARRQMASTFKPILYAEALEEGIRPCYYLDNDSIQLSDFEEWSPENFDKSHGGKYSLSGALIHSMNIPSFNLFMKIRFSGLDSLWKRMGFSFPLENNPSLAMGTAEANIMEAAIAYASFANGGFKITTHKIVSIMSHDGEVIWQNELSKAMIRVIKERTSLLMSAILQRAVKEGTGVAMKSVYGVTLSIAGKTGTSQDNADAWFAAFNPSLVVVSRVGASLPSVHFFNDRNGSGSALALPLVAMTLKKTQENRDLRNKLMTPFPLLSPELTAELDCPDFKEKKLLESVVDFFKRDKVTFNKDSSASEIKKQTIFQRIFGKKKNKRKG